MRKKIHYLTCLLLLLSLVIGCGSSGGTGGSFDEAVHAFESANALPSDWSDWILARRLTYATAYNRGLNNPTIRVEVSYDREIVYDPPWDSEAEHFAALKRLAELTFTGWTFSFSDNDPGADVFAVLGHTGDTSYAQGDTIHLVWEGIFSHEISHTLGIQHHYCGDDIYTTCSETPPGEGTCIMSRDSSTWGPTEQFLLSLSGVRNDAEIEAAIEDINGRY